MSVYNFQIKGLNTGDGTISWNVLTELGTSIKDSSEKLLKLVVEGNSEKSGNPKWLKDSLDFVIGLKKGSTVLQITAPKLGDTLPKQQQQNLWTKLPDKEETAISLFEKAFTDATNNKLDSKYLDKGVLASFKKFNTYIAKHAETITLYSPSKPDRKLVITKTSCDKISFAEEQTPPSQTILLSGKLNLLEHNKTKFNLLLDNNKTIGGIFDKKIIDIEKVSEFWGKQVTLKAKIFFRPNRSIHHLEAEMIKQFENSDKAFEQVSVVQSLPQLENYVKSLHAKNLYNDLWGKWPGDESEEELQSMVEELS